jgi:hypothetical protein
MRHRNGAALAGSLALVAALAAPAFAQDPTIEVVAEGLDTPRGIDIASDGSLWVAAAGANGDTCMDDGFCYGPTGAILHITDGDVQKVIEGLPSAGSEMEVGGVSDVALIDDENFYFIMNLGTDPGDRVGMPPELATAGWLMHGSSDGTVEPVADISAFESTDDPDAEFTGGQPDSNPFSVAVGDGGVAVADAGGNDLLLVDDSGTVSLAALFPPTMHEFSKALLAQMGPPPEGEGGPPAESAAPAASDVPAESAAPAEGEEMASEAPADGAGGDSDMVSIPVQAVPTSVVVGPDGAYYVGQLTGGPFPIGGASVFRVVPGEDPTVYATGFTNIIDLGFASDGTLYVAEIVHDGLMGVFGGEAPPVGAVLSVPPGGGDPTVVASGEQVMAPGGLAVGADGSVYVTTGTIMGPGAGAVIKITP